MLSAKLSFDIEPPIRSRFALRAPNIFHNLIRDALARLQFNLDLHRLGFLPKRRALIGVPGGGWTTVRFVRRGARKQAVFARGDIFELERAVSAHRDFGVAQDVVSRRRYSRNEMNDH